jgi:DNA-binding NtrC family response regulator
MPASLQIKLLRVIQEREFRRVGDPRPIRWEGRIVAATHRDLRDLIGEGKFREDLYYRINVFPLPMPPLRDHREDIPLLIEHFTRELGKRPAPAFTPEALRLLMAHAWRGNIRELRNAVEYSCVTSQGKFISAEHLPPEIRGAPESQSSSESEKREIKRIEEALAKSKGNRAGAAKILGYSRVTLWKKMKQLRLKT